MEASECAFDTITEAFELVAQDEARKVSIVQEIMIRSTDYLRRIITPVGGHGGVTMSYLCSNCNSFPLEDYIWEKKGATIGGVRSVKRNTIGSNQTGFWSYKQVKVSIRQGLCANLINALMLLAKQQEGGDGLIQNIVTNPVKRSRKGLTEGLREFMKIDIERALEVGYLNRGMGTFEVRKPNVPEGCLEVMVRENLDELTLRGEEVGTLKTYINVNHIEEERWDHPLG